MKFSHIRKIASQSLPAILVSFSALSAGSVMAATPRQSATEYLDPLNVYRGRSADEARTPAEKVTGNLEELLAATRGKLSPSDTATLAAYSRVDREYRQRVGEESAAGMRAVCSRAESGSDRQLVEEMMRASRANNIQMEEYYNGLLNALSEPGRRLILETANARFGGGMLVRPNDVPLSEATQEQIALMARNAKRYCETSGHQTGELRSSDSNNAVIQQDVR